ncbi:Cyanobacteria-specific protein related to lipidA disaccharide synthetase [Gloeomargarita lithophora Alchichica-D10]|uniref:Cyanobacteria-specific protein related to lipidA disaccharide synthetase n=1 Tax=Gloeomargarita lithophora Alchichica-D10 TaxID=1188229 RepID=A0A1J0AFK5_9CYAN|nr:hypothetical protein [Gloeomargarita lithophora]APB34696.1 Cyanobacteria-specific protein related to lipidA disaccharide synthetase [Gloeomargarita lithophora Alchichica-D10]
MPQADVLILTNGPGEVSTWVRPVVAQLHATWGENLRISVVLSPCPHSTGEETQILQQIAGVARVQAAEDFWPFLLWGRTAAGWDWLPQGVALFLGGDPFYTLVCGGRLGYATLAYAEVQVRWPDWFTALALAKKHLLSQIPPRYQPRARVVGDLMVAAAAEAVITPPRRQIGLLPGSKPNKLTQGVPFCLTVAAGLAQRHPDVEFILPVAPTLTLAALARYADPQDNPIITRLGWESATLEQVGQYNYFVLKNGLRVRLVQAFPAYSVLRECCVCITTVGANTAELCALGVPMLVLVLTHQTVGEVARAWDGIPGVLANLPGLGWGFATAYGWWMRRRLGLLAWPNIWAGRQIVPELIGAIPPEVVGELLDQWLTQPETLAQVRRELLQVRGAVGADREVAAMVGELLANGRIG